MLDSIVSHSSFDAEPDIHAHSHAPHHSRCTGEAHTHSPAAPTAPPRSHTSPPSTRPCLRNSSSREDLVGPRGKGRVRREKEGAPPPTLSPPSPLSLEQRRRRVVEGGGVNIYETRLYVCVFDFTLYIYDHAVSCVSGIKRNTGEWDGMGDVWRKGSGRLGGRCGEKGRGEE